MRHVNIGGRKTPVDTGAKSGNGVVTESVGAEFSKDFPSITQQQRDKSQKVRVS